MLNWFKKSELEILVKDIAGYLKKCDEAERISQKIENHNTSIPSETTSFRSLGRIVKESKNFIDLLRQYDSVRKEAEQFIDNFDEKSDDYEREGKLDLMLLTAFNWLPLNGLSNSKGDLNPFTFYEVQRRAYETLGDKAPKMYETVEKVLRKNKLEKEADAVHGLSRRAALYSDIRNMVKLGDDQVENERRVNQAEDYWNKVEKEHNEILYHIDALYKDNPKDKTDAINFFVELGANKDWSEENVLKYSLSKLAEARTVRDTAALAFNDAEREFLDQDNSVFKKYGWDVAHKLFGLAHHDTIEGRIQVDSIRVSIGGNFRDGESKKIIDNYPMQPYKHMLEGEQKDMP